MQKSRLDQARLSIASLIVFPLSPLSVASSLSYITQTHGTPKITNLWCNRTNMGYENAPIGWEGTRQVQRTSERHLIEQRFRYARVGIILISISIAFATYSYAQDTLFPSQTYDAILVLRLKDSNVKYVNYFDEKDAKKRFVEHENLIMAFMHYSNFRGRPQYIFRLTKGLSTMTIQFEGTQDLFYYLDNFEFKPGSYRIIPNLKSIEYYVNTYREMGNRFDSLGNGSIIKGDEYFLKKRHIVLKNVLWDLSNGFQVINSRVANINSFSPISNTVIRKDAQITDLLFLYMNFSSFDGSIVKCKKRGWVVGED